jgi:hypothetical protein
MIPEAERSGLIKPQQFWAEAVSPGNAGEIFFRLRPVLEDGHEGRRIVDLDTVDCFEHYSRVAACVFYPPCNDEPAASASRNVEQRLQLFNELRFEQQRTEFACRFAHLNPLHTAHQPRFGTRRTMRANSRPNSFALPHIQQFVVGAVEKIDTGRVGKILKRGVDDG